MTLGTSFSVPSPDVAPNSSLPLSTGGQDLPEIPRWPGGGAAGSELACLPVKEAQRGLECRAKGRAGDRTRACVVH